jgi:uncharacterized protein YciI
MSVFAVTYHYTATAEELAGLRPAHREFFGQLFDKGDLLTSGPFVDYSGALLLVKADSVEEVSALLDNDPFDIAGYIGERVILQWNPLNGPFASLA